MEEKKRPGWPSRGFQAENFRILRGRVPGSLEIIWRRLSNTTRDHREDHKREPIKDLIVSGFDSSEGEISDGGCYTPLHETEKRPKHHLVVKGIHVATPTLIWERESDWETTG